MSENFNEKENNIKHDSDVYDKMNTTANGLNDDVKNMNGASDINGVNEEEMKYVEDLIDESYDYDCESSSEESKFVSNDDAGLVCDESDVESNEFETDDDIKNEVVNEIENTIDDKTVDDNNDMDSDDDASQSDVILDNKVVNSVNKKISAFKTKDPQKKVKRISIISAAVLVLILIFTDIIPILPNAYNRFYVGNTYDIGETQGSVFNKFGENVLYAGNGVVMSFGCNMECNFKVETPPGIPRLETTGSNAIIYYANSSDAVVILNNSDARSIKTNNIITSATVNNKGYYGLVTKEPGYKSYVEIFNSSGNSVYKYHTNNPIIDVAVSDNGKSMIASSYELNDSSIIGKLIFIDLTSDKPGKEILLDSNLVSEVKFLNKDTVAAIGDVFTSAYSVNGVEKWKIKYNSRSVKSYDVSSNGDIAFIFDRYTSELSESTVEVYGTDGNLKGKYESKQNIKYISANNNYFLLSLDRQTILLDDEADVVKKKNTSKDFRKAVLYSNYNFAFSISDGVSEIMSVKH